MRARAGGLSRVPVLNFKSIFMIPAALLIAQNNKPIPNHPNPVLDFAK
jgi:hypothetical protein